MDERNFSINEAHYNNLRSLFYLPKKEGDPLIYFSGNSLGLLPKSTEQFLQKEVQRWADLGALGYFQSDSPWVECGQSVSPLLATMVGAHETEVVAMNSLGINLHLMLASFYQPSSKRYKILIEEDAFPTDRYIVESQILWHGFDPKEALLVWEKNPNTFEYEMQTLQNILKQNKDSIALAVLPGVQYYTGEVFQIKTITEQLKNEGIIVGWDLAHAIGNISLDCHHDEVDFAVWCHYKYLNSGPGAVGGCFIHENHAKDTTKFRLQGWWGVPLEERFNMHNKFLPYPDAKGWQISNVPIFSFMPLKASLEIFQKAGTMAELRKRSLQLTNLLIEELTQKLGSAIEFKTPKESSKRGCQISFTIQQLDMKRLVEKLRAHKVVCDYRPPDVIRVAPVPLYNTPEEIIQFSEILKNNIDELSYEK